MSKSTKDLLSFLFLESAQADADELDIAENLEQIFEAAAQEAEKDLESKKTPLAKALAEFGISDADLQLDTDGFCLVTDNHQRYMDAITVLGSADAMHKLAEMGWVVTKPGDNAMTNEPPDYRIRFLEITTVDQNDRELKGGTYDTANREEVIKKAQKFATTPMDRDNDDLNPVEGDTGKPDKLDKSTKRTGVGKPKEGEDPEKAIHDAIESGDVDKLLEMTTTGSMGTVDAPMLPAKMLSGPQYEPAEGIIKKPKPYGKGTSFHMPGQWKVKQPIVNQQVKRHPKSEALGADTPEGHCPAEMSAEQFLEEMPPSPGPATQGHYDDIGTGQYDYMGMDERFPLHVEKAKAFFESGDMFNAAMHARAAIEIGARGYIGTPLYVEAEQILQAAQQR